MLTPIMQPILQPVLVPVDYGDDSTASWGFHFLSGNVFTFLSNTPFNFL